MIVDEHLFLFPYILSRNCCRLFSFPFAEKCCLCLSIRLTTWVWVCCTDVRRKLTLPFLQKPFTDDDHSDEGRTESQSSFNLPFPDGY